MSAKTKHKRKKPAQAHDHAEDMVHMKLLLERYETAKKHRDVWSPHWEESYDYALPQRSGFFR